VERSLGASVRVAVIDSGIDGTAPELGPSRGLLRLHERRPGAPAAECGHGTTWRAHRRRRLSFRGVAPKVEFIGLKVLDAGRER
jgi:hypothetical protein